MRSAWSCLRMRDDLAQHLGVEAVALGLGVDFLDVVGDRRLLFFHALDALDEGAELVLGDAVAGNGIGHAGFLFVFGPRSTASAPPGSSPFGTNPHPAQSAVGARNSAKSGVYRLTARGALRTTRRALQRDLRPPPGRSIAHSSWPLAACLSRRRRSRRSGCSFPSRAPTVARLRASSRQASAQAADAAEPRDAADGERGQPARLQPDRQPGLDRPGLPRRRGWQSEGWWVAQPGDCATVYRGDLERRYYYIYAADDIGGGAWDGSGLHVHARRDLHHIRG